MNTTNAITHATRAQITGSQRNVSIATRGLTILVGRQPGGNIIGCTTTQVDFLNGSKEARARKEWNSQTAHNWIDKSTADMFVYVGHEGGVGKLTPDEAALLRQEVQKYMTEKYQIAFTGRLTSPAAGTVLPEGALKSAKAVIGAAMKKFAETAVTTEVAPTEEATS